MNPERPASSPSDPSPAPSVSVGELAERCMGNLAIAELVLNQFEKQARADLEELSRLLSVSDLDEIGRRAHALKGAAGAVAAGAVHEHAAALERSARQTQPHELAEHFKALQREVERCLADLPAARARLAALPAPSDTENAS